MIRRDLLTLAGAPALSALSAALQASAAEPPLHRVAAGWRSATPPAGEPADRVGLLELDWAREQVRIVADLPAPGRVHGLAAMPDGGFVAVAARPGAWLLRCDAAGRPLARHAVDDDRPARRFNGHVLPSPDGQWLYTTETASPAGMAWIGVRDARTLQRVTQLPSAGIDAHHMLLDDDGRLFVANGGLLRADDGRKIELDRMQPTLAQIDPLTREVIGRWRLDDARLSLRHLAWSVQADGSRLLGIGLQAEHDEAHRRREAPGFALLRAGALVLPSMDAQSAGYVGDIAPGPAGGFVLSGQKAGRGLWWHPQAETRLTRVAELTELCALAPAPAGGGATALLMAAARGVALWHPSRPPRMLPWPQPMLPDNHWALLAAA